MWPARGSFWHPDSYLFFRPLPKRSRISKAPRDYEKEHRSFGSAVEEGQLKHLLPIKRTDGRIVAQTVVVKPEDNDGDAGSEASEVNGDAIETADETEDLENPPSMAELYARREKLLSEYKQRISSLCFAIIENPQEKVRDDLRIFPLE